MRTLDYLLVHGMVAQLVEQETFNFRAGGFEFPPSHCCHINKGIYNAITETGLNERV